MGTPKANEIAPILAATYAQSSRESIQNAAVALNKSWVALELSAEEYGNGLKSELAFFLWKWFGDSRLAREAADALIRYIEEKAVEEEDNV